MAESILDPPRTLRGVLRNIGPGLILAGGIVGSGELVATTRTGAEAGFALLWLIGLGQLGGIVGGVGQALKLAWPIHADVESLNLESAFHPDELR